MHIISRKRLREFWEEDGKSQVPLDEWYRRMRKLAAKSLAELRKTFPQADLVGKCTVFNVGGNKYRLITKIDFQRQTIYIKFVLTHSEYDKNKWKASC